MYGQLTMIDRLKIEIRGIGEVSVADCLVQDDTASVDEHGFDRNRKDHWFDDVDSPNNRCYNWAQMDDTECFQTTLLI